MDDLQFRRSIYADPHTNDDAIVEAKQADAAKQKFAQEIVALDAKIAQALQVPVPDDLYDNLILRQTLASHQQQKRKTRIHLAMAASVAFAMGLTFNFMQFSHSYSTMGEYAIAHINHEAKHFSNNSSNSTVTLAALNQKMASFNGQFDDSVGKLLHANFCRFDGMKSLHLVFQGSQHTVTVFVIPQDNDLEFSADFNNEMLQGASQRFEQANIIIVADKNESLQQWQTELSKNIRWSI